MLFLSDLQIGMIGKFLKGVSDSSGNASLETVQVHPTPGESCESNCHQKQWYVFVYFKITILVKPDYSLEG